MKDQIEAEIAALEAQARQIAQQIAEKRARLENWLASVPAELHNLTQELFDKIKTYFGG